MYGTLQESPFKLVKHAQNLSLKNSKNKKKLSILHGRLDVFKSHHRISIPRTNKKAKERK